MVKKTRITKKTCFFSNAILLVNQTSLHKIENYIYFTQIMLTKTKILEKSSLDLSLPLVAHYPHSTLKSHITPHNFLREAIKCRIRRFLIGSRQRLHEKLRSVL